MEILFVSERCEQMFKGIKFKNIFFILLGSAIFSFGLVHFNIQNELAEGGFTGITLILLFAFKWDPALMNLNFKYSNVRYRMEVAR